MTRREKLLEANNIYVQIQMSGTYTPAKIEEGYLLVYPEREATATAIMKKQFFGFMQYLYNTEIEELNRKFLEVETIEEIIIEPTNADIVTDITLEINTNKISKIKTPKKKRVYKPRAKKTKKNE